MTTKQTGGPAFPLQPTSMPEMHYFGMTLRDYFAGQALAGLFAQHALPFDHIASAAYGFADAMLKERDK